MSTRRQSTLRLPLRFAVLGLFPLLASCESASLTEPESIPPLFVPAPGSASNFAVALDGAGDHVDMSAAPVGTPASITVEAWVKLAETGRLQALANLARDDFNDGASLWIDPGNRVMFNVAAARSASASAVGSTALETGVWYHVAGVYDHVAGVVRVFLNGVEDGSVIYTQGISYNLFRDLQLGKQVKSFMQSRRFLNGALDEVRIWDFARSEEEIAADMSFEIEPTTGLVGYWRMNEGEGRTAADLSGLENTGNLSGDASWIEATWRQERVLEVPIDVLPGQSRNFIVTLRFITPVAILSNADLDATRDVDRASLTFGRTGDEATLFLRPRGRRRGHVPVCGSHDVDRDGRRDLVCLFKQRATGLRPENTEAVLKGRTVDGVDIIGRDRVIVWRPGRWWR